MSKRKLGGACKMPHYWKNEEPRKFYPKAVRLFGKPIYCADVPHGAAKWLPKRGLFDEHLLIDESVKHCQPAKHKDYFYSYIKFYVPPSLRLQTYSLSGSVGYDGLKKMLSARCASLEANIATLYLSMMIASGKLPIKTAKKKGLYGKYIRGEMEPHSELIKKMIKMKQQNHKKYKKQLAYQFDPLAFKSCSC